MPFSSPAPTYSRSLVRQRVRKCASLCARECVGNGHARVGTCVGKDVHVRQIHSDLFFGIVP